MYTYNVHPSYIIAITTSLYVLYTPTGRDPYKLVNSSHKYHNVDTSYIVIKIGSMLLVTSEKFGWQHFIVTEKRSFKRFTPRPRVDPKKKQIIPHRARPAYTYYIMNV